jgi:hypothetical protein
MLRQNRSRLIGIVRRFELSHLADEDRMGRFLTIGVRAKF